MDTHRPIHCMYLTWNAQKHFLSQFFFRAWCWYIAIYLWWWFLFCYFQTSAYVELFCVKNIMISFPLPCNCEQHWRVCLYWSRKLSLGLHPVTLCRMRGVFVTFQRFIRSSGGFSSLHLQLLTPQPWDYTVYYVFLLLLIVFSSKLQNKHLLERDDRSFEVRL